MASKGSPGWLVGDRSPTFCEAELEGLIDVDEVLDELL